MRGHWDLTIAGVTRRLPVRRVAPDVSVAYFQAMGDVGLCEAVARGLVAVAEEPCDVVVGPELKAVVLAHEVARLVERPYVILRKQRRAYLTGARSVAVRSVTSGGVEQRLWLADDDVEHLDGRRVWLVDDVLTTGSSLAAARALVEQAGGTVVEQLVALTEGAAAARRRDVRALGHLPLFDGAGAPTGG
jgi:adenine phosphoribosyltransferase